MTKVTLNDVGNLIDATTARTTINDNNATIETAFDNTLSRDGTQPNQMNSILDMNSKAIVNLPSPIGATSPLRLQDLVNFNGGGTIQTLPAGGLTGQSLQKASNTNYDFTYGNSVSSVGLALPSDFTVTNSPVTTSGTLTGAWALTPTGTGAVVRTNSPVINTPTLSNPTSTTGTFTSPTLVTPTLGAAVGTSLQLSGLTASSSVATDGSKNLVSITNTGTGNNVLATSPTLVTPVLGAATGTSLNLSGLTASSALATDGSKNLVSVTNTGTGNNVLTTSPTITTPNIVGVTNASTASVGSVGERVDGVVLSGSAVSLTNGTAATIKTISLTAGDWEISGVVCLQGSATTNVTSVFSSISTSATPDYTTPGRFNNLLFGASGVVPGAGAPFTQVIPPTQVNVSSTTTMFLTGQAFFTVSTLTGYGEIHAIRIR